MTLEFVDRLSENTRTTGTGDFALIGQLSGYQPFSTIGDGNTVYYEAVSGNDWERGTGTYAATNNILARTTISASSNSGSKVNFNKPPVVSSNIPAALQEEIGGGGGSPLTVTDGTTSVDNVTEITLSGATVTDEGGGNALVTIAGGGGGSDDIQTAVVTITSAQLLALQETPVTLVDAPGAGKSLILTSVAYEYDYGTTPYTGGSSGDVWYGSNAGTSATGQNDMSIIGQAASSIWSFAYSSTDGETQLLTATENQPIVYQTSSGSDWTGGDGTLTITVKYYVAGEQGSSGGAPTFTLTASGDIAAGSAVSVNSSGDAVQTWGPAPNISGVQALASGGTHTVATLLMNSGATAVTFTNQGVQAFSISGDTITDVGALATDAIALQIFKGNLGPATGIPQVVELTTTTFAAIYNDGTTNNVNMVVGTIGAGNAISWGTPAQLYAQQAELSGPLGVALVALSPTLVLTNLILADETQQALACTITGTAVVPGIAPVQISSSNASFYLATTRLTATSALLAYQDPTSVLGLVVVTTLGTVLTVKTPTLLAFPMLSPYVASLTGTLALVLGYAEDGSSLSTSGLACFAVSIDGSDNVDAGTVYYIGGGGGQSSENWITPVTATTAVVQGVSGAAPMTATVSSITDVTFTPAVGVGPGNNFLLNSEAVIGYPGLSGPVAVLTDELYMFADGNFAIYEGDNEGNISPRFEHQFLTGYWLYPLSATKALAVLTDLQYNLFVRVIDATVFNVTGPIGITALGASDGDPVTIQNAGIVDIPSASFTPQQRQYSSGDGSLVTINTGHLMGTAISATKLAINIRNP